ncbi:alpha/beta fold hydrolase [Streptomyces sioyaensis]|uniref:alpha/beta fold hydrolase n=1 Tax=Streptomyces sioyaensis TaxID=67364 RepID=UPI003712CFF3
MPQYTHDTVPSQFVEAGGVRYAYRRFGEPNGTPLVFFQHFMGSLDDHDSALTDAFAQEREVILFNNAGVASSGGRTPDTIEQMARDAEAFIGALGLTVIDVLAHSMGGLVGQQVALDRPELVRKLVLVGTAPRGGQGLGAMPPRPRRSSSRRTTGTRTCGCRSSSLPPTRARPQAAPMSSGSRPVPTATCPSPRRPYRPRRQRSAPGARARTTPMATWPASSSPPLSSTATTTSSSPPSTPICCSSTPRTPSSSSTPTPTTALITSTPSCSSSTPNSSSTPSRSRRGSAACALRRGGCRNHVNRHDDGRGDAATTSWRTT